jgi:hypothetical protein
VKKRSDETDMVSWLVWFGLLALTVLASPLPAFSQNCALCYTQAASSGARMIAALKSGILILIIPPTLATVAMIFVVHNKRNQIRRTDNSDGWETGDPERYR